MENKSAEIYIPEELIDTSKSKDFHKLGQVFSFESDALAAYWGGYWREDKKKEAIYIAYFKLRNSKLMRLIAGPAFPDRKAICRNYFEHIEDAMNLIFKSIDGRDGAQTIDDKGNILNKQEGIDL